MKKITLSFMVILISMMMNAQIFEENETDTYVFTIGDIEHRWTDDNSFNQLHIDNETRQFILNTMNSSNIAPTQTERGACILQVDCSNIVDADLDCRGDLPPVDFDLPIILDACNTPADVILSALTIIPGNSGCPGDSVTITRTYFIQDLAANMEQCMQTFTVESLNDPTLTCDMPTITEMLDASCSFALGDYTGTVTPTSDCSPATITQSPVAGTVIMGATTTVVTITATDFCGRMTTCTIDVVTEDMIPPTAVCSASFTVELDANGEASITASDIDNGSSDTCGAVTTNIDISDFDCTDIGDQIVTLTVMDGSGNMAMCSTTVTVIDMLPPTLTCSDDIIIDTDMGACEATVTVPVPMVIDNCSVLYPEDAGRTSTTMSPLYTRGQSKNSSANATFGTVNGVTIQENNGTAIILEETAIINAATNRMMNVPNINLTQSLDQETIDPASSVSCNAGGLHTDNSYIRLYDLPNLGYTDDFQVTSVNFGISSSVAPSGTQPLVLNIYSYNTTDPFVFGNFTLLGSTDVELSDTDDLVLLNEPLFGVVPAGQALVVEIFTPNGQADGNSIFVASNFAGQTGTSFIAAAGCGVSEPEDINALGPFNANWLLDVNQESPITLVNDYNNTSDASDVYPLGDTTVTWTATDGNGNVSTCTQIITVEDNETPLITGPVDIFTGTGANDTNCGTVVTYDLPTATDNCETISGVTITQTAGLGSGSEFPVGTTTEEYTVNDGSNDYVYSFDITITDTTSPSLPDCPDELIVGSDDDGNYTIEDFTLGIEDNCTASGDLVSTQEPVAGTVVTEGSTTTVTVTSTDEAGNTIECTFDITVDSTLSTNEAVLDNSITIFPNPTTSIITIRNNSNQNLQDVTIVDMNGRIVLNKEMNNSTLETQVNLNRLAIGVYFAIITSDSSMTIRRIAKK